VEKKRALGRGLDALLPALPSRTPVANGPHYGEAAVFSCPVERIVPQAGQPRQHFDEAELEELTRSIREHGIIQPIVVRKVGGASDPREVRFELIAGERRWRAAQRAGLHEVPVVVKDVTPAKAFELALIENLQRADLNAIEVAESYDRLLREHHHTHEILAERVGKDRSTVTNALRLLKLPVGVRTLVIGRQLSEGHARAILGAPDDRAMQDIADKTIRGRLAVRKVEALVRAARIRSNGDGPTKGKQKEKPSLAVRDLESRLARRFGARVDVRDDDGGGEVAIHYGSLDELDRILGLLGVS